MFNLVSFSVIFLYTNTARSVVVFFLNFTYILIDGSMLKIIVSYEMPAPELLATHSMFQIN